MAICKRRDRIVVFRVTDEEHQHLQQACERSGNRNLSEFVRLELLNRGRKAARTNMAALEKKFSDLESTCCRALQLLQPTARQRNSDADDIS